MATLLPFRFLELETDSSQTAAMTQTDEVTLPTESRIKQKERLKAEKEAGTNPRKIKEHIEDGSDDCGEDDSSGLGKDISKFPGDVIPEILESSDDDEEYLFISLPPRIPDTHADAFTTTASTRWSCAAAREARQT